MRHQTSRELYQYWNELRANNPAPSRHDFEPSFISAILPSIFMLELQGDIATLRLAGGDICGLFGDELRGKSFGALWLNGVERRPSSIAAQCAKEQLPFVIMADGLSNVGTVTKLELLLLPMESKGGMKDRVIGSLADLETGFPHSKKHIKGMSLTAIRHIDRDTIPVDFQNLGRRIPKVYTKSENIKRKQFGHFSVIDGGREN